MANIVQVLINCCNYISKLIGFKMMGIFFSFSGSKYVVYVCRYQIIFSWYFGGLKSKNVTVMDVLNLNTQYKIINAMKNYLYH